MVEYYTKEELCDADFSKMSIPSIDNKDMLSGLVDQEWNDCKDGEGIRALEKNDDQGVTEALMTHLDLVPTRRAGLRALLPGRPDGNEGTIHAAGQREVSDDAQVNKDIFARIREMFSRLIDMIKGLFGMGNHRGEEIKAAHKARGDGVHVDPYQDSLKDPFASASALAKDGSDSESEYDSAQEDLPEGHKPKSPDGSK